MVHYAVLANPGHNRVYFEQSGGLSLAELEVAPVSYTHLIRADGITGSIEPGKLADLVALDEELRVRLVQMCIRDRFLRKKASAYREFPATSRSCRVFPPDQSSLEGASAKVCITAVKERFSPLIRSLWKVCLYFSVSRKRLK